jgi:NADPH2:quinone reductase
LQAAYYEKTGPAREVLRVGELATPEPGPGEVRVRIRASGVNPSDVKNRKGGPGRVMAFPLIVPHSDGAGEIDKLGEGVDGGRLGERVWTWNAQFGRAFGTAAEYVVLPEAQAVRLPEGNGFDIGACLGIPLLTAYRGVTLEGPPGGRAAGQTLLIAGGAGAVGHYAIQIAKRQGATVLTTVSSAEKAEHAKAAGADHVIDYKREDVAERVREITDSRGVDRVLEVDFAGNAALAPQVLAHGGTVVVYGSNQSEMTLPFAPYLYNDIAIRFYIVYRLDDGVRRSCEAALHELLESGDLLHTIAARYPLAEAVAAQEAVESGQVMGNVVVEIN